MLRIWMMGALLSCSLSAQAALNIEIVGAGENQIPIAIVPLAGEENLPVHISEVVAADLQRSGLFRIVDNAGKTPHNASEVKLADWAGTDDLMLGSIEPLPNERMEVRFRLFDMVKYGELMAQAVSSDKTQLRAIAHFIADLIFEKLTGTPGVFSTRIAYVNRNHGKFKLMVADSDGFGERAVFTSSEPLMSPAWSPDGSHLAYVSFERGHASIYVQSLLTGQRLLIADYDGSNSSPAWSPDGRQMAIVLSKEGNSQIYLVKPNGTGLTRLSHSEGIDTEPCFSPDGASILFTSDRGGKPQIYRMPVNGGQAERLTFSGGQNFSPRYSPDGKSFVFAHMEGGFHVTVQDFETGQMQMLTEGGWEKHPTFAPNGKLILYASEYQGRGILSTVSSDGRIKQRMSSESGDVREPVWGPFLKH